MLSPSPSSTSGGGCSPARSKSVSVICSATDFSPNALHLVAVGASDGESGVSWMEDVEEKGGGGVFLSPATDSFGVSSCRRRRGVGGYQFASEGGKVWRALLLCSLSLWWQRGYPVVCLLQSCLLRELLPSTEGLWSCGWRGLSRPLPAE